jgi:hypothetical protein
VKRAFIVWLAVACAAVPEKLALADTTPEETSGTPIMRVYVSGSPAAVARLTATVRELCARLNLDVVVEEASSESVLDGAPAARLKAFVDLRSQAPRIIVIDSKTRREVERRTLPTTVSLEMSVEEAAHVLYMAAESAFPARSPAAGEHAGTPPPSATTAGTSAEGRRNAPLADSKRRENDVPRKAVQPPEPTGTNGREDDTPLRRTTSPRHFELELGGFGGASVFGPSEALVGLGAFVDGGVRSAAFRFSVALSVGAYLPSTVARDGATASLHAETGRMSLVGAWHATPAFVPFLSVGAGGDRITMNANAAPGAWAAPAQARVDPMLQALLGAKIRLSANVAAFFAFGTDVDLAPHRYVIETNGARQTFLELGRVRPSAFLGLTMAFSGVDDRGATGGASP